MTRWNRVIATAIPSLLVGILWACIGYDLALKTIADPSPVYIVILFLYMVVGGVAVATFPLFVWGVITRNDADEITGDKL
jgi:uncharacterized membrane protein